MTYPQPRAAEGYGAAVAIARDPRSLEHEAIRRATAALLSAREGPFPALAAAVHRNRLLWAHLGAQAADPANALPPELRARLLWLARYAADRGSHVLREKGGVEDLVEVNRAVMQGLRRNAAEAA